MFCHSIWDTVSPSHLDPSPHPSTQPSCPSILLLESGSWIPGLHCGPFWTHYFKKCLPWKESWLTLPWKSPPQILAGIFLQQLLTQDLPSTRLLFVPLSSCLFSHPFSLQPAGCLCPCQDFLNTQSCKEKWLLLKPLTLLRESCLSLISKALYL